MIVKILTVLSCAALFSWGGFSWHNARRYLMPVVIALAISLITHKWWSGLLVLPVMGTLCVGYFSDKNWGRALWVFMQAITMGLGLFLFGFIAWYLYFPYVVGAGILGGTYKNIKQIFGDMFAGAYLACIILLVR